MPLDFLPEAVPTPIGWVHPITGEQLTAGAIPVSQLGGDEPVDFYKPNAGAKSFLDPGGETRNLISTVSHGRRVELAVHSLDTISSVEWTFGASVKGATITAGGTGYTSAPSVTFAAAPAGGVRATGTAVVTDGVVTGIVITEPGAGYLVAPAVSFSGGAGSGAAATSLLSGPPVVTGHAYAEHVFPTGVNSVKAVVSYEGGSPAPVTLNTTVTVA